MKYIGLPLRAVLALVVGLVLGTITLLGFLLFPSDPTIEELFDDLRSLWRWVIYGTGKVGYLE